jgi:hypothetical protein
MYKTTYFIETTTGDRFGPFKSIIAVVTTLLESIGRWYLRDALIEDHKRHIIHDPWTNTSSIDFKYRVVTDLGDIVPVEVIMDRVPRKVYGREIPEFKYRHDPVPFVHKSKWHRGVFYRRPKTTQERRAFDDSVDQGFTPRKRRAANILPNAWDDIPRHREKNWKKFRRTQWK